MNGSPDHYTLKEVWTDGKLIVDVKRRGDVVVKRFRKEKKEFAKKEYDVLSKIRSNSTILVPEPISIDADVITMGFIDGEVLDLENVDQTELENRMLKAGVCLGKMHQLGKAELGDTLNTNFKTRSDLILLKYKNYINKKKKIGQYHKYFQKEEEWLVEQCKNLPDTEKKLVHGDLSRGNVMVVGDEIAIIDFESAQLGYVEDDLARFVSKFYLLAVLTWRNKCDVESIEKAFLEGYKSQADYHGLTYRLMRYAYFHRLYIRDSRKGVGSRNWKMVLKNKVQRIRYRKFLYKEYIKLKVEV